MQPYQINLGKQVHTQRATNVAAVPNGESLFMLPKKAFVYDVLFHNPSDLPPNYYGNNRISLGVAGSKEWFGRKTDISGQGVHRAVLGKGAGALEEDTLVRLFWHYTGQGQPQSGPINVLVVYDLS